MPFAIINAIVFFYNIFGKFAGDLDRFTDSLEDGKTVYVTERKL